MTAHQIAQQEVARQGSANMSFKGGAVMDCTVEADGASFYPYTDGPNAGYRLIVTHNQLAYDAVLAGDGGVADAAILDFKSLLGSFTWRV